MNKPTTKPRWTVLANGNDNDVADPTSGKYNVVAPSSGKQDSGFDFEEYPPRQFFNWLARWTFRWIDWLDWFSDNVKTSNVVNDSTLNGGSGNLKNVLEALKGAEVANDAATLSGATIKAMLDRHFASGTLECKIQNGLTTTPTFDLYYYKHGDVMTIVIPSVTGTAHATETYINLRPNSGDWPDWLLPFTDFKVPIEAVNENERVLASMNMDKIATAAWQIVQARDQSYGVNMNDSFSTSGTKGTLRTTITYPLLNPDVTPS